MLNDLGKQELFNHFMDMIKNSWTYDRLTEAEKRTINRHLIDKYSLGCIKGTNKARWDILNLIYFTYLLGLGYTPVGWREKEVKDSE